MPHLPAPVPLHDIPETAMVAEASAIAPASDLKTFFLGGLFAMAFLTLLYVARDIAMPVVLAFVLKLVLQPLMRILQKWRLPRMAAAVILLLALVSAIAGLGTALSTPAAIWVEKMPQSIPKLQERLLFLSRPLSQAQKVMVHAEDIAKAGGPKVMPVEVQGNGLSDKIIASTRSFAGGLFTTMLVLFFLLISGDTFLRRLVEVLPRFKDKRRAVDISQQIEQDISLYLVTITAINAAVGFSVAMIVMATGLGDPQLWGTLAFFLNYIPIIGPLIGMGSVLLAGLMADIDGFALLPAAFYLFVHMVEGSLLTPWLLARRFTLNPVLVILSLVFWSWMWGVPGAILAMPMLAITKIICDRIQPLMPLGHFLEG